MLKKIILFSFIIKIFTTLKINDFPTLAKSEFVLPA